MRKYSRFFFGLGLCLLLLVPGAVAASSSDISGSVAQSYTGDPSVLPGMIVEFKAGSRSTVVPLPSQDVSHMLGVVVPLGDSVISLTPQTILAQQVLVATSGHYSLLVSNQNSSIKSGDYLTISALAGIGMKAGTDQSQVVGRASGDFNGSKDVLGTVTVKGSSGRSTNVTIGRVPVDIRLSQNPFYQKNANSLPGFLSKTANGVVNKSVSTARVYMSAIILLATLLITGSMLYSSVRGGFVAIGRNPLSRQSIIRGLLQTVLAGLVVFAIGVFTVYLILKF